SDLRQGHLFHDDGNAANKRYWKGLVMAALVKSRHMQCKTACPLYPPKATSNATYGMSVKGPIAYNQTKRNVCKARWISDEPTRLTLNGRRHFRGRARPASCPIQYPPRENRVQHTFAA